MDLSLKSIKKGLGRLLFGEAGGGSSAQITNSNIKNFIIKHIGWNSESEDYAGSENDLTEVQSAINTDSYIKAALDKTAQLVMKSGYKFESDNENALEYLKGRIAMMEFGTSIPFDVLLDEIARNLVYYSNCFLVKSRIDKIQGGLQAKPVLGKKPVGGYFVMDPTAVEIKRDKNGTVSGYKLTGTEEQEFKAEDVIHIYVDRDAGNSFGTPRIISSLEDVKILRKIEGNTLSLIYRFSIPLYQMKIGLPETNFMATDNEISEAQKQINKMPMDGIIVTNERTQFLAIGAEGKAIDLSPYLDYYEKRVFTGLNVSEAMMGRGGSKQDADSMEGLMHDTVKHYQIIIKAFLEKQLINEILLEGGFNPIFNEEDRIYFRFNEINLDSRVKYENHLLNQFQSNCITFEEMRQAIGRDADSVDEGRLYTNMITTPSEIEVVNAKNAVAASSGNGNVKNGKTAAKSPGGSVKSTSNPTNQHGSTSAKIKEGEEKWLANQENHLQRNPLAKKQAKKAANSSLALSEKTKINAFRDSYPSLCNTYKIMRNNILKAGSISDRAAKKYASELETELCNILNNSFRAGYENSMLEGSSMQFISREILLPEQLLAKCSLHAKKMVEDIQKKIAAGKDINDCFDLMEYRLRDFTIFYAEKANNTAVLYGYKDQGIQNVSIIAADDSSNIIATIDTGEFTLDDVPPYTGCAYTNLIPEAKE